MNQVLDNKNKILYFSKDFGKMQLNGDYEATDLLILVLKKLDLVPKTGNGRTELIFQDGFLLDTISSNRTRIKLRV